SFHDFVQEGFPIDPGTMTANFLDPIEINGKTYDGTNAMLSPWSFTNLTNFDVPGGSVQGIVINNVLIEGQIATADNAFLFFLKIPPGELDMGFLQSDLDPSFWIFSEGRFGVSINPVPEPGTLGLMGTGLLGVVGAVRRKRPF